MDAAIKNQPISFGGCQKLLSTKYSVFVAFGEEDIFFGKKGPLKVSPALRILMENFPLLMENSARPSFGSQSMLSITGLPSSRNQ